MSQTSFTIQGIDPEIAYYELPLKSFQSFTIRLTSRVSVLEGSKSTSSFTRVQMSSSLTLKTNVFLGQGQQSTHTFVSGCSPLKAITRGKYGSFEPFCYFEMIVCLPTESLANLVSVLRITDTPMHSPLRKSENLALFLCPSIFIMIAERASAARSLGAASLISSNFTPLIARVYQLYSMLLPSLNSYPICTCHLNGLWQNSNGVSFSFQYAYLLS